MQSLLMSTCEQYSGASIAVICGEDVQISGQSVDVLFPSSDEPMKIFLLRT
jgi:hypothetical protein